jgi:hypothetical protein
MYVKIIPWIRRANKRTSIIDIFKNFFLKSDMNFIRQFVNQNEFKPISKRQFVTSKVMRILYVMLFQSSDTFHKEFVPS